MADASTEDQIVELKEIKSFVKERIKSWSPEPELKSSRVPDWEPSILLQIKSLRMPYC